MTKEFAMTNVETSPRPAVSNWSFGLRHSLVNGASSLVIRVLTLVIRAYQLIVSPAQVFLFGHAGGCRFTPTCSQYALEAIRARGALTGGWLAAKRIGRCHPWGRCGHDPVPRTESRTITPEPTR
jgi:putative membrane protein insertion efficiency factor